MNCPGSLVVDAETGQVVDVTAHNHEAEINYLERELFKAELFLRCRTTYEDLRDIFDRLCREVP